MQEGSLSSSCSPALVVYFFSYAMNMYLFQYILFVDNIYFKFTYFDWIFFSQYLFYWLTTILWWFLPYIDMNQPWVYTHVYPPVLNPVPPPSPSHPSGLSQCTSFECPVSSIKLGLVIYFTQSKIHVFMLFSQIIPPSPCPTESKSLFFISVSLLLSCIWRTIAFSNPP